MTNQKLELTWLGKGEQPRLEPRLLLLEPEHCHGNPNTDNILIHGDNLLALKALEQQYAGKVKCIYIDPPYNTGNAFEHYDDMVEHSIWLNLMFNRLQILWNLVSNDGTIWISIDDDEVHYLRVIMDQVFGRQNFIACNVWQKRYSRENREAIGDVHEYVIVYAKNPKNFKQTRNKLSLTAQQKKVYRNPNNDPKGDWRPIPMTAQEGHATAEQYYEIISPSGKLFVPPQGRCWGISKKTFENLRAEGKIYFGKNNDSQPNVIRYLSEIDGFAPWTWWTNEEVGHTDEAKKEIHALFGKVEAFDTPKPERLVERIIHIATNPGDLILDSFLGSGTTAAVAHKMKRRWIGIELGEHCYTHCVPRLRKVVSGEDQGGISKAMDWKGGGGFKTYRLAPSLLAADEHAMLRFNPDFTDDMVAEAVAKIEGFTYAPDPEVFWKQSRSSEQDYLLVTKIFVTAEWLAQLHVQMAEGESLLLCCPAYGDGCERAFSNISIKKIPHAFMRKYEFGKDDYSLNVENVIGGSEDAERTAGAWEEDSPDTQPLKKAKRKDDQQPTLF